MTKTTFLTTVILSSILLTSGIVVPSAYSQQAGTTLLEQYVTTDSINVKEFGWTIQKSADPTSLNLFTGDSSSSQYTVEVTKDAGTITQTVFGQVCGIENGGAVATEGLAITVEVFSPFGGSPISRGSANVDVSSNPVLDPGEVGCYDYEVVLTSPIAAGDVYKVDSQITITNHSGHLGEPFGPSPDITDSMATQTLVTDSINVSDTNGDSWSFSDSGSETYSTTFTCNADEGQNDNTATINETGADSSASVTVNCYAIEVSKTADTSFTRTYEWSIDKNACSTDSESNTTCDDDTEPDDQLDLNQQLNQIDGSTVDYTVDVSHDAGTDTDHAVSGTITISNPAPMAATLTGVSDTLSDNTVATVNCDGVDVVPANDSIECSYNASLSDASTLTNTATATLQNTPSGETDFSGSADVVFGEPTTVTDECVDVTDVFDGLPSVLLGQACVGDNPSPFLFSEEIGPYTETGEFTTTNTATFTTTDTGATGDDVVDVIVTVDDGVPPQQCDPGQVWDPTTGACIPDPCEPGDVWNGTECIPNPCDPGQVWNGTECVDPPSACTLTIGYWKNHAGIWSTNNNGKLDDQIGGYLPITIGDELIEDTEDAVAILDFSGSGNDPMLKLKSQLLAAKLNIAAGADGSSIAIEIGLADQFIIDNDDGDKLKGQDRHTANELMSTFDQFNNGELGPLHCND